jgi:hypothetical protein
MYANHKCNVIREANERHRDDMEVLLGIYLDHVSREEDMSLWGTLITHHPCLIVVLACFKCSVCTEEYGKTLDGEYR